MQGTTTSNFDFVIEDELLDDWDVLEGLCAIDRGEMASLPITVKQVLGIEQFNRLKDHVRNENGRVSTAAIMTEFSEMINYNKKSKNS